MNYKIKNMLKKITKRAMMCSSFAAFYIAFFVSFPFIKMAEWYTVVLVLDIFYLISRIVYRIQLLKECDYIKIEKSKIDYSEDQKLRANYFGDIMGIIMYLVLIVSIQNPKSSLLNGMMSIPLTYCFIYFACAYVSVLKNYITLKAVTVLSSTIQGMIIILLLVTYVLERILYVLNHGGTVGVSFIKDIDIAQGIIIITYVLENYPLLTIVPMVITLVLFIIYIYMTPVYQLGKLKLSFQIVNIFMVLIGILSFFAANYFGDFINTNKAILINSDMYKELVREFKNGATYYENYGTGNVKNLFYLAILPYTFGILTANVFMELRLKRAEKKSNKVLEKIKESKNLSEVEMLKLRKKFFYYGGQKLDFDICEKIFNDKTNTAVE